MLDDTIRMIADHPKLSDHAKQRLIALAMVLKSIEDEIVRSERVQYESIPADETYEKRA